MGFIVALRIVKPSPGWLRFCMLFRSWAVIVLRDLNGSGSFRNELGCDVLCFVVVYGMDPRCRNGSA